MLGAKVCLLYWLSPDEIPFLIRYTWFQLRNSSNYAAITASSSILFSNDELFPFIMRTVSTFVQAFFIQPSSPRITKAVPFPFFQFFPLLRNASNSALSIYLCLTWINTGLVSEFSKLVKLKLVHFFRKTHARRNVRGQQYYTILCYI